MKNKTKRTKQTKKWLKLYRREVEDIHAMFDRYTPVLIESMFDKLIEQLYTLADFDELITLISTFSAQKYTRQKHVEAKKFTSLLMRELDTIRNEPDKKRKCRAIVASALEHCSRNQDLFTRYIARHVNYKDNTPSLSSEPPAIFTAGAVSMLDDPSSISEAEVSRWLDLISTTDADRLFGCALIYPAYAREIRRAFWRDRPLRVDDASFLVDFTAYALEMIDCLDLSTTCTLWRHEFWGFVQRRLTELKENGSSLEYLKSHTLPRAAGYYANYFNGLLDDQNPTPQKNPIKKNRI